MSEITYSPAAVCAAAGVERATFHSWIARGYFKIPKAPGKGRARRFRFHDALLIAIAADFTRLGFAITSAAEAAYEIVQWTYRNADDDLVMYKPDWLTDTASCVEFVSDGPAVMVDIEAVRRRTRRSLLDAEAAAAK